MTPAEPEPAKPLWKNPFVIAFVIGVVVLTVLPFAQRRFLRAPPPGPSLGAWELTTLEGQPFGAAQLKGRVWVAGFAVDDERQKAFASLRRHLEDLDRKVILVSFVLPQDKEAAARLVELRTAELAAHPTAGEWVILTGSREAIEALAMGHFRAAFVSFAPLDAGATLEEFMGVPTLALVDHDGALRGFWPDSDLGRGNLINAARLLSKYGPRP